LTNISDIEGIGVAYAETLAGIGIETVEELLQAGGAKAGREDLAAKSGISETLILEWVNRADLMRIKGIGSEFSDLWKPPASTACLSWPSETQKTSMRPWQRITKPAALCGGRQR
jgi:predicted flap endonuclease-1-like 5' DNA nuclease